MNYLFDIFADSSANLTDELAMSTQVKIIPFIITVNGEDFACYDKSKPFKEIAKPFYEKLASGADIKTSLIGEDRFFDEIEPTLKEGRDAILITIASGISGTYNQAVNASKALMAKYPERKVFVVDSANASLGEGLLAVNASRLRDLGESAETCYNWLEENKYKLNSYLTVDDLKYLRKGGRISLVTSIAGTILNIKPLIKADGGSPAKLSFYGKERGRRKALETIARTFSEKVENPENQTVAIAHCNCEEDALKLADMVKERGAKDVIIEYYDLCTASHAGPGTVALFFMGKDRRPNAAAQEVKKIGKTVKNEI